jgi:ABC-type branched-subunit amino acid transport system substrate-binding protein
VVQENDQSIPALAATLARKCVIQDHANFVFGPEETGTTAAALPVLNQLKVVNIGWQSGWNADGFSQADLHSYGFPAAANQFHEDDLNAIVDVMVPQHLHRVAIIEDSVPGGIGNDVYTKTLSKKYDIQVVGTQEVPPGATDDTPAVLALLAKKPQMIQLSLIPGPDTITAIKSVRAQNPTIPMGECSGCALPSFIAAAGGTTAMKNVYILGDLPDLAQLPKTPANAATLADVNNYIKWMKAAGYGNPDILDNADYGGWNSGEELNEAITTAHSISTSAVLNALDHQKIDALGVHFARTPANHGLITEDQSSMVVVGPSGALKIFDFPKGGPGETT